MAGRLPGIRAEPERRMRVRRRCRWPVPVVGREHESRLLSCSSTVVHDDEQPDSVSVAILRGLFFTHASLSLSVHGSDQPSSVFFSLLLSLTPLLRSHLSFTPSLRPISYHVLLVWLWLPSSSPLPVSFTIPRWWRRRFVPPEVGSG